LDFGVVVKITSVGRGVYNFCKCQRNIIAALEDLLKQQQNSAVPFPVLLLPLSHLVTLK
jgi:hypothetical protein